MALQVKYRQVPYLVDEDAPEISYTMVWEQLDGGGRVVSSGSVTETWPGNSGDGKGNVLADQQPIQDRRGHD